MDGQPLEINHHDEEGRRHTQTPEDVPREDRDEGLVRVGDDAGHDGRRRRCNDARDDREQLEGRV